MHKKVKSIRLKGNNSTNNSSIKTHGFHATDEEAEPAIARSELAIGNK